MCEDVSKILGFVLRMSREFTEVHTIKQIYYSFVVSKLEYASVVWNPIYATQQHSIEKLHRWFQKYLSFRINGQYPERGANLDDFSKQQNIESLYSRREKHCVTFLKKLINNSIDYLLSKLCFRIPRAASRTNSTFQQPAAKTNLLMRSPIATM